jgi:multiple sugar transport system permease protein
MKQRGINVPLIVAVVLLGTFVAIPLYTMLATAFKTDQEIYGNFTYFPRDPSLVQFKSALVDESLYINIRNSIIVAGTTTVLSVVISIMAAYAIVRLHFRGKTWVARTVLFKYLLPTSLLFIPLFVMVIDLGLANTLQSLILTYLSFTMPFATWLMMGYFRGIPVDLEEQAMVDGSSRIKSAIDILLPQAAPGIVAAAIFTFTLAWNEFLLALVFISDTNLQTVPVKIAGMIVGDQFVWGMIMASALIASVPVVILYYVAQRFIVSGLSAGAVKG